MSNASFAGAGYRRGELWYPQLRAILPAVKWVFLTSQKGQPFPTSDNPLFFFEDLGIGRPESEITFPISSSVALWATWRRDLTEGCVPAKTHVIKQINKRTASAATKYVYYSQKADWVINLINKRSLRTRRIT